MAVTTVSANNKGVKFMGRLNTEQRKALPKAEFAEPAERKYPVPDKSHAANAKARASEMLKKGVISEKEHAKIVAKADKVLGNGKS